MPRSNLTLDEARRRAGLISEPQYDVHLDLTGDERFRVETTIRFRCAEPGAGTFLDCAGVDVVSAVLNGRSIEGHDGLRLPLRDLGDRNELRVTTEGPYSNTGKGLNRFVDPVDGTVYVHTDSEPFDKYDQVVVPEFAAGAMENPGCVTFHEHYIFRSRVTRTQREMRAGTILHEMAHMWFGDLVTMRWWDDLWLNESFASYMGVLSQSEGTKFREGWTVFANSEKTWALQQDQLPTTHPIVADIPDLLSVHLNFDGITYAKGASVLKQLVAWVGREQTLEAMKEYFARHGFGNTELVDFLRALEDASGRDLDAWSKE